MSPGEQMIDLVHIDDVVRAYLLAAYSLRKQSVGHTHYGVSSGAPISLKELVAVFEEATQISLPVTFGGRPYRAREVMVPWSKYPTVPKWRPQVPIKTGIQKTCTNSFMEC